MNLDNLCNGTLAVARRLGLSDIATADKGFDAAKGFKVYKPTDIVIP